MMGHAFDTCHDETVLAKPHGAAVLFDGFLIPFLPNFCIPVTA